MEVNIPTERGILIPIAIQYVNKEFVYTTDCNPPLRVCPTVMFVLDVCSLDPILLDPIHFKPLTFSLFSRDNFLLTLEICQRIKKE